MECSPFSVHEYRHNCGRHPIDRLGGGSRSLYASAPAAIRAGVMTLKLRPELSFLALIFSHSRMAAILVAENKRCRLAFRRKSRRIFARPSLARNRKI